MSDFATHTSSRLALLPHGTVPDDVEFVIEQHVIDGETTIEQFHLVFAHGTVEVNSGPAAHPNVVLRQDIETANALRSGQIHAQRAFLTGRLSIDGDIDALLKHRTLLTEVLRISDA